MGAVRKKRTRETRKRKCGRWRGGPKPCVFNDSIKTKIRARILCARVRRESGPESGRFYELSSRDRRQKSGVVRVAGGRCNCRRKPGIERNRQAPLRRLVSPVRPLTTMRGSREFSRIGTRVTFPLTLRVKGRANIWNKSTRRRGKDYKSGGDWISKRILGVRVTGVARARLKAAMNRIDINGTATWLRSRS